MVVRLLSVRLPADLAAVASSEYADQDPDWNPKAAEEERDDGVDEMVRRLPLMERLASAGLAVALGLFDRHVIRLRLHGHGMYPRCQLHRAGSGGVADVISGMLEAFCPELVLADRISGSEA